MTDSVRNQKLLPMPDVGDIIFVLLLQIPLFLRPTFVFGDGSTGWHLVVGQYILQTHTIPHQDLISFTFPDQAWVAYEWLSDVIMAMAVNAGGLNLLAVLVSSFIGLLFILLYDRCRKEGCHFLSALFLVLTGALISAVHWLARPHLFTFFGVYLFYTRLEDYYRGTISGARLAVPLTLFMIIWVNSHPAFLLGFALIIIYLASALLSALYFQAGSGRNSYMVMAKHLAFTLLTVIAASFINPYGPRLYQYIFNYLKGSIVLSATDEFASPVFHMTLQPFCLEILFASFIAGLAISRNRLSLPRLITCLMFGHLALSAVRNMPLYVIIALPAIAHLLAQASIPLPSESVKSNYNMAHWCQLALIKWKGVGQTVDDLEFQCKMHLIPIAFVALLVAASLLGGRVFGVELLSAGFDPKDKPSHTLDYLRNEEDAHKLDFDRGFNYDNWGGYIKYKLGTRVFIDDRADFYGERFYIRYAIVSQTLPGWKSILDQNRTDWILFPKDSRLVSTLRNDPDWRTAAEDEASTLLIRAKQKPN